MDAGQPGGFFDRGMAGARTAIGDVVGDRQREDQRRLQHHADLAPQRGELVFADVDPVDRHAAAGRIEKPRQQAEQGGLPGPGRADDRDLHAGADHNIDLRQNRALGAVAKADVAPRDIALRPLRRELARATFEVGFGLQHLEHPGGADLRAGNGAPALGDLVDRVVELGEIRDEDDQLAERQCPRHDRPGAGVDHDRSAQRDDDVDRARI